MFGSKTTKFAAILIGGVLSVFVLVMGFSVMQRISGRAEDQVPRDVVIETTSSTAKISWTTATKTQGVIEYGASQTTLNSFAPETESDTNHSLELTLLTSGTTYYFQISIGGKKYDNAGVPWTFRTKENDDVPKVTSAVVNKPTPISTIVIRQPTSTCREIYCHDIKEKLGKGCSTQDYFLCIRKLTPTKTP